MKTLFDTIKELHDVFYFHEFENGVRWLNEKEASDFAATHPRLVNAIQNLILEAQKYDEWHND